MKTLTKILSVAVLVALCVCLFTLTAFAAPDNGATIVEHEGAKDPTCTAEGWKEHWIDSDGDYYDTKPVTDSSGQVISPSASVGTDFTSVQIAMLPHECFEHPAKPKDCRNGIDGNSQYWECKNCHQLFSDSAGTTTTTYDAVKIDGTHNVSSYNPAVPATCVSPGMKTYGTCSDCGCLIDGNGNITTIDKLIIPATGDHTYSTWTTIKPPTNVSPGLRVSVCDVCGAAQKEETIPATGIIDGEYINYVIAVRDTWAPGEEPPMFESPLVEKLNAASGGQNWVGVRIGTDSLYENSYDTYDFWSWGKYVLLGEKTVSSLRPGMYRLWIYDRLHPDVYTNSVDFWILDVPSLEPYSTDSHVVNSSKSLRFIASEEIDPNSVMVGSRKLYDSSDFFVSNDRKSITLSPDFLNARQTGTYTISAVTKDGRTIKTNFYILSTAQASSSPRTGDESQIGLWAAFLLLSGAAIIVMVPKLRKSRAK